jgi:putative restriction endonuclease
MPRFWWVNHRQTHRQEIDGNFLWSPKRKSNGAYNYFYETMRQASPGDLVLSYANGQVAYVGRVAEFAVTAAKPSEFGAAGANWSNEGWYLPVFWTALVPAVRPKDLWSLIQPLLPRKYSPLNPASGDGLQAVYLAEIPEALFEVVTAPVALDRDLLALGGANSLAFPTIVEQLDEAAERRVLLDRSLADTVRSEIILARRGQGEFRRKVQAVERACRVTGIDNPALLIASHIKPWRVCPTAEERLDGMNGLMLTPDVDLLFDRGFLSFKDDGEVLVSERMETRDLRRLGLGHLRLLDELGFGEAQREWGTAGFAGGQQRYLDYHRSQVFVQ